MKHKPSVLKKNFALTSFFQDKSNIGVLILLIACYFVFFWRLGGGGIRQWDESSLAVNSLEMILRGDPIVKHMGGQPDLINTKPMLAIWAIGICMKLFGYNEFALRLPSAICALATVMIIYGFCKYYLNQALAALISSFVLITAIGFTGEHVARNGDYDAMLVLWVTLYSLSYFIYLGAEEQKDRIFLLSITTLALILAVWTKGIAGLIVLPGLFVYTLYKRKLKTLLVSPYFYFSTFTFLFFALGWYFLREYYNPGYLKAVIENELTGRYMDVVPGGTVRGFFYYFANNLAYRFVPWIYFLPICWLAVFYTSNKNKPDVNIKDFSIFSLLYLSFYFFIISYSKSKFNWYDAPLYPIAALTIGLGLSLILLSLLSYGANPFIQDSTRSRKTQKASKSFIITLAVFSILFLPYINNMYSEIYKGHIPYRENDTAITESAITYRDYFKELGNADFKKETQTMKVVNSYRYNLPLLFYVEAAEISKSYSLELKWENASSNTFRKGEIVVNCGPGVSENLRKRYETEILHHSNSCQTIAIAGEKS
jgi:4-amino-4-deoxy-L-arabinose transferase-like glycosyltransferase